MYIYVIEIANNNFYVNKNAMFCFRNTQKF